jgi:polysaccharide export outer membrane protein
MMTRSSWLAGAAILGVNLITGSAVLAQTPTPPHQSDQGASKSQNAKDGRAWSLKSGPGAPHNILPGPPDARMSEENMFLRMPKLSSDYVLGEGDKLDVEMLGGNLDGSMTSLTISNSGTITLPYLGEVQASGLTAADLEGKIAHLFKERELVKNPEVLVYVTDYKANPIFVMGEVDNPGEYMMSQELTLMEAILMAGGIDPGAGSYGYLHRRTSPEAPKLQPATVAANPTAAAGQGVEVMEIDLRPLKLGGVPEPDVPLRKGDIIVIPKSKDRRYYVLGDVRSPGTVEIPPPAERVLTASQAIAHAGGPTPTAKMSQGVLVRYKEDGSREEKKVDFLAILKGRQPDFEVQPNDIIFIPGSSAKTLAYGLLGQIPGTIQSGARGTIMPGR